MINDQKSIRAMPSRIRRSVLSGSVTISAGNVDVKAGDYIIRGDQPFRTLADMYFAVQNYAPQNPSSYDDTGWTFQYMRDVKILPVTDANILHQQLSDISGPAKAAGGIEGTGSVLWPVGSVRVAGCQTICGGTCVTGLATSASAST